MFGDNAATMLSVLVFLATGTLAFAVMIGVRAREAVRRRAARVGLDDGAPAGRRSLRYSGLKAAQKLVDYTTKHYSSGDSNDMKMLRRRLIEAGIYDPHGAAYFFLARAALAVGLAGGAFFGLPMFGFAGQDLVLAVRDVRRRARLSGAELLSRPPHQGTAARASGRAFPISWICWWSAPMPA